MTTVARSRRAPRARPAVGAREPAAAQPVARVAVDVPLAHLDRPFDYLVEASDSDDAQPGVRVRVRFAGRLVNGFILARADASEHAGKLSYLDKVVSPEMVLTTPVAALCRAVADRYAGTLADVLRLAVPPRHARVEADGEASGDDPVDAGPDVSADPVTPRSDVRTARSQVEEPGPPRVRAAAPRASEAVDQKGRTLAVGGAGDADGTAGAVTSAPGAAPSSSAAACDQPGSVLAAEGSEQARDVMPDGWRAYEHGAAFLSAVTDGRAPRAVWQALPGEDWPARLAEAALAAFSAGRGALIVVPDARDLARLDAALAAVLPEGTHTVLSADLGPAVRYRRFLAVKRGRVRVVAGTRAAAFAPVENLGLVAVFDDGDDVLAEPRAPYPHAREVLMLRSAGEDAALIVGGFARTAEGQLLVESGWARDLLAPRAAVRERMPRIAGGDDYAVGSDSAAARARIPPNAFAAARRALDAGAPVLVQVPRRGYLPALACVDCGRPARCRRCSGPLAIRAGMRSPSCRWCGVAQPNWVCPACAGDRLKATATGAGRTAEEIGRAFPGVPVITSSGEAVRAAVPASPRLVVATVGGEPVAEGGYGTALLLDGFTLLGRGDLRAGEEALRRWMTAAALVKPASAGGQVVVSADAGLPTVQALIRWDPVGHAAAELAARRELGFPPAVAMASITGADAVVGETLREIALPAGADVLGPVPVEDGGAPGDRRAADDEPKVRALLRVPIGERKALAAAVKELAVRRSLHSGSPPLRLQLDPTELG